MSNDEKRAAPVLWALLEKDEKFVKDYRGCAWVWFTKEGASSHLCQGRRVVRLVVSEEEVT